MTITIKIDLTQSIIYTEEGSSGLYRRCEKWAALITSGDRYIQPEMLPPPGLGVGDSPREAINFALNDLRIMDKPV